MRRELLIAGSGAAIVLFGCAKRQGLKFEAIDEAAGAAVTGCLEAVSVPIPGLTRPQGQGLWSFAGCGRQAVVARLPSGKEFVIDRDRMVDYSTEVAAELAHVCPSVTSKLFRIIYAWPGPGPWSVEWVHPWEVSSPTAYGYSREDVAMFFDHPRNGGGEVFANLTVPPEQVWIRYYDLTPDTVLACLLVTDEHGAAAMYDCYVNDAANTYSHDLELCRAYPPPPWPKPIEDERPAAVP